MIISYDFHYPTTLYIKFNVPLGAGSYKFKDEKEIKEFYNNSFMGCYYSYKLLIKCIEKELAILSIFKKHLRNFVCNDSELIFDFESDTELKICNINLSKLNTDVLKLIDKNLKQLLFNSKK